MFECSAMFAIFRTMKCSMFESSDSRTTSSPKNNSNSLSDNDCPRMSLSHEDVLVLILRIYQKDMKSYLLTGQVLYFQVVRKLILGHPINSSETNFHTVIGWCAAIYLVTYIKMQHLQVQIQHLETSQIQLSIKSDGWTVCSLSGEFLGRG